MNQNTRRLLVLLTLWALAATVAGHFRLLGLFPSLGPPVLLGGLVAGFYGALLWVPWLRAVAASLPTRVVVAAHAGRFLGFYFLWLEARGRLPAEFAERAGWGDVAAALGAVALLLIPEGRFFSTALKAWNWFGLLDLAVAVGTARWLRLTRPGSVDELAGLPLTLVPLFLVPVLVTSHIVLLRRPGWPVSPRGAAPGARSPGGPGIQAPPG